MSVAMPETVLSYWAKVALVVVLSSSMLVPRAAAQELPEGDAERSREPTLQTPLSPGAPPEVGAVVFEDSLTARGALWAGACDSRRNGIDMT